MALSDEGTGSLARLTTTTGSRLTVPDSVLLTTQPQVAKRKLNADYGVMPASQFSTASRPSLGRKHNNICTGKAAVINTAIAQAATATAAAAAVLTDVSHCIQLLRNE